MCECVACEMNFREYWNYMKHLVTVHGYTDEAAKTLVIDMVTWVA